LTHILKDLSSLVPSTSSSINPANSFNYFSDAYKAGQALNKCPQNIKFKCAFPDVISVGLKNFYTPNLTAFSITFFALLFKT